MSGLRLRQNPIVEAMLLAGKRVAIVRLRGTIVAELRGDHCSVEFLSNSEPSRWIPVPMPTFYDEVREFDEAVMASLLKRRA